MIESSRLEMASWSNFKLFRPKLSPNRTKNGHFSNELTQSNQLYQIVSFVNSKFNEYLIVVFVSSKF